MSVERPVEFAAECRNLSAIRIGARRCGVESALAIFSEMIRIRPAWARRPDAAMVSVLRKSKVVSQPCGARLALAERRLDEIEAARVERGCCLKIHLVGGDLHHLLFEIDGVAGWAHFVDGRIFVWEWRLA